MKIAKYCFAAIKKYYCQENEFTLHWLIWQPGYIVREHVKM